MYYFFYFFPNRLRDPSNRNEHEKRAPMHVSKVVFELFEGVSPFFHEKIVFFVENRTSALKRMKSAQISLSSYAFCTVSRARSKKGNEK